MVGASGFAGTGAWIWAWGKHRSEVTQDAKAARFLSSANQQGVNETPACPIHPVACLTAAWESLKGARRAAVQAEFQQWGLCHIKAIMGCSLHPGHAKCPHPPFFLPLGGCRVWRLHWLSPGVKLPPPSVWAPLTQQACGVLSGRAAFPPRHLTASTASLPPPAHCWRFHFSLLWIANKPHGNYRLLSDMPAREQDIIC